MGSITTGAEMFTVGVAAIGTVWLLGKAGGATILTLWPFSTGAGESTPGVVVYVEELGEVVGLLIVGATGSDLTPMERIKY